MDFSLEGYGKLLDLLKDERYAIADYHDWGSKDKCVILRHDIDTSLEAALDFARFEQQKSVSSTYFVLLTSEMYNVASLRGRTILGQIRELGHEIGLHFDEVAYDAGGIEAVRKNIEREAAVLSELLDAPITTVSMHRPSKVMLESDMKIPGMVNSYGRTFFKEFKYVSDSRMRWREPVEEIIRNGQHDRLHILTHAFWYTGRDMGSTIVDFIKKAAVERYAAFAANFTDLESVVTIDELSGVSA